MNLTERARLDSLRYTSDSAGFALPVTFTTPEGFSITVNARATRHSINYDSNGIAYNSRNASVTVHESLLFGSAYPVRNAAGDVAMKKHKVTWTDANGVPITYMIDEQLPDEALGLIVFILGDYAAY